MYTYVWIDGSMDGWMYGCTDVLDVCDIQDVWDAWTQAGRQVGRWVIDV